MNKSDLIDALVARTGHDPERMALLVRELFAAMAKALSDDERVDIRGFGSLTCRHYPSRLWFNRRTGQVGRASARRRPYFKAGKALCERIDAYVPGDAHQAGLDKARPGGFQNDCECKVRDGRSVSNCCGGNSEI